MCLVGDGRIESPFEMRTFFKGLTFIRASVSVWTNSAVWVHCFIQRVHLFLCAPVRACITLVIPSKKVDVFPVTRLMSKRVLCTERLHKASCLRIPVLCRTVTSNYVTALAWGSQLPSLHISRGCLYCSQHRQVKHTPFCSVFLSHSLLLPPAP